MIKRGSVAIGLGLFGAAACTTAVDRHRTGIDVRLVGTWAHVAAHSGPRQAESCETDFAVSYAADGTFSGYEQAGTWRVEGSDLIETVTQEWDMGGGPEVRQVTNPTRSRARIRWLSRDAVNLLSEEDGGLYGLVRCLPHRAAFIVGPATPRI